MKTKQAFISLLVLLVCFSCRKKNPLVAIQPLGQVDVALIDTVKNTIETQYGFQVVILPSQPLPKSAFVNIKSPRYRADKLLKFLKKQKPDSIDYVLGITEVDISTTKRDAFGRIKKPETKYEDWGVIGLGNRPGPSCILSTYRIKTKSQKQFLARLKKVCVHEMGHNLGLKHCEDNPECVMRDAAETVRTIDKVGFKLCESCRLKTD